MSMKNNGELSEATQGDEGAMRIYVAAVYEATQRLRYLSVEKMRRVNLRIARQNGTNLLRAGRTI